MVILASLKLEIKNTVLLYFFLWRLSVSESENHSELQLIQDKLGRPPFKGAKLFHRLFFFISSNSKYCLWEPNSLLLGPTRISKQYYYNKF